MDIDHWNAIHFMSTLCVTVAGLGIAYNIKGSLHTLFTSLLISPVNLSMC